MFGGLWPTPSTSTGLSFFSSLSSRFLYRTQSNAKRDEVDRKKHLLVAALTPLWLDFLDERSRKEGEWDSWKGSPKKRHPKTKRRESKQCTKPVSKSQLWCFPPWLWWCFWLWCSFTWPPAPIQLNDMDSELCPLGGHAQAQQLINVSPSPRDSFLITVINNPFTKESSFSDLIHSPQLLWWKVT